METAWERRNKIYKTDHEAIVKIFKEAGIQKRLEKYEPLSGGLGNTSYKVHLEGSSEIFVLRIYTGENSNWNKENGIFKMLQNEVPVPQLVYASNDKKIIPKSFSIFKYIKGHTLAQLIHNGYKPQKELTENIGEKLSLIHQHEYEKTGFLSKDIAAVIQEEPLSTWIEKYAIDPLMNGPARNRIRPDKIKKIITFLEKNSSLFDQPFPSVLLHGDFKPTNLLINDNDELAGIMDWEFAFSGPYFFDIGQILRYEDELPGNFYNHFFNGYQRISKYSIQKDWLKLSKLADMVNLIGFLNLIEERPKLFKDVRLLIKKTIKNWKTIMNGAD